MINSGTRGILLCAFALVCTTASTAVAQSTRGEWLELRERKRARQAQGPSATVTGVLSVVSVRFFSDAQGRLVGVGEARNNHATALSYSRLEFAFRNARGALIGAELTYVLGGANALIPSHGHLETVLQPGVTGFFKVWTSVPASSMSSYAVTSAGEALPFGPPVASIGPIAPSHPSTPWSPMVYVGTPVTLSAQRVSGTVLNDDPVDPFCPCGHDSTLAYAVRVAVAAYQDGVITDVQTALAEGPRPVTPCDEPATTGMSLHESARFTIDLDRPANSIGRHAVEWEEVGARPLRFGFLETANSSSFSVGATCGWTATPNVPWIEVTENRVSSSKAGIIGFRVSENTTTAARDGSINVGGTVVGVSQQGTCLPVMSPATAFVGSGTTRLPVRVDVSSSCFWGVSSNASWLRAEREVAGSGPDGTLLLHVVQPNLTGATRSTVVTVGNSSLTVVQNPGSRNSDLNGDGHLDLVWQHQTDGSIGTWLMRGSTLIDGTLFNPGQVSDTNWKIVGTADLDEAGFADLVWQHAADGRLAVWRMRGTTLQRAVSLTPGAVPDTNWKIRGVADFTGDGRADLVWQNQADGRIALWTLQGETSITADPMSPGQVADLNWKIVGTGDFDGDTRADLVWQHQADGRIAVWRMRGTLLLSADPLSPGQLADLNWKIRGAGDVNGDDMPDLLWQHQVSGHVSVWLMNRMTMMSGISLGQVADTNWHIVGPR